MPRYVRQKPKPGVERLVRKLSGPARRKARSSTPKLSAAELEIRGIVSRDYRQALRRCLSQAQVHQIVSIAKTRVWPHLNREPVRLVSLDEFVRRWSTLGVDFKFASLSSKSGLSLLGFYLTNADGLRERPLIFANTAHHPALVGLALDHEMGHHLTAPIFGSAEDTTHLLSLTAFEDHLTDPLELSADTLVSLGVFPAPVARSLFQGAKGAGAGIGLPNAIFDKVLEYITDRYGVRLELIHRAHEKVQALAALVHYTKLRRVLLAEYDV
jgi:hypothetical protein